tara:strand:- start:56 stop:748 length:693 start_codon:yes stop_codon:yes gene_type:complete
MNSAFKQKFSVKSPLAQKEAIKRFVYNTKSDELNQKQKDSLHGVAIKNQKGFYSPEFDVSVDVEDGVLSQKRNPKHPDFKSKIYQDVDSPMNHKHKTLHEHTADGIDYAVEEPKVAKKDTSPLDQKQFGNKGMYEKAEPGDLIDETVHEESIYKSNNLKNKISGMKYNVENLSEIQKDEEGQFMTTLDDSESYGGPRPTSSTVTNYDQGKDQPRDTLRPFSGKSFYKPRR